MVMAIPQDELRKGEAACYEDYMGQSVDLANHARWLLSRDNTPTSEILAVARLAHVYATLAHAVATAAGTVYRPQTDTGEGRERDPFTGNPIVEDAEGRRIQ